MKIRLSSILLLVACAAIAFGWYSDRTRLSKENRELNEECAELFQLQTEVVDIETDSWPIHMTGRPSRKTLYDANDPEDRARYKRNEPSKLFARQPSS